MKSKYVKKHECVIIGGGAAGMMAAVQLAGDRRAGPPEAAGVW